MKVQWLALTLATIPAAYAQTSNKCADLTKFRIPGSAMVITKAVIDSRVLGPGNGHRRNIGDIRHHTRALPGGGHD